MTQNTNPTQTQKEKINSFISLALEFNKTHNIFARKSADEVLEKDINDCKPLIKMIPNGKTILDLGSGRGFSRNSNIYSKTKKQDISFRRK